MIRNIKKIVGWLLIIPFVSVSVLAVISMIKKIINYDTTAIFVLVAGVLIILMFAVGWKLLTDD